MRIGILTSVHAPLDTRVYFKQARSLARAGHEVVLVAREGGSPADVQHVSLPVPKSRLARVGTNLRVLVHALRLRCDVYHLHDPELLPIGVLVKAVTGAQLVYDVHENVRHQILNKFWISRPLRRMVARAYDMVERVCLRWVDRVVLAEDSYAAEYRGTDFVVVRNYPILADEPQCQVQRTYSSRPILAYVGMVTELRGGLEMLEAVAVLKRRLPAVELRVIGPFLPESFGDVMRKRVETLGLTACVKFFGRLPMDAALREVRLCDVGLALLHPDPNYLESLPTKMFEYMSMRLPVVVSHFPLWRRIVEDAGCGVAVDPCDPEAIAEAIASIGSTSSRLRELGDRGRRAVVQQYSWAVEERKLLDLYESLGVPTVGHPSADRPVGGPPRTHGELQATNLHRADAAESVGGTVDGAHEPVESSGARP